MKVTAEIPTHDCARGCDSTAQLILNGAYLKLIFISNSESNNNPQFDISLLELQRALIAIGAMDHDGFLGYDEEDEVPSPAEEDEVTNPADDPFTA